MDQVAARFFVDGGRLGARSLLHARPSIQAHVPQEERIAEARLDAEVRELAGLEMIERRLRTGAPKDTLIDDIEHVDGIRSRKQVVRIAVSDP